MKIRKRAAIFSVAVSVIAPASIANAGYVITNLSNFDQAHGVDPNTQLILSGNTLYGTTSGGGVYNGGTVFSVPLSGGTPTVLASFNGSNGQMPTGLVLSGNTLYGTTELGGSASDGNVFSLPTSGGNPVVIGTFSGANGIQPRTGLLLSGSTLYGTTAFGGPDSGGTIFSLPTTGGTPAVVASFNGATGANQLGALTLSNGLFYGTTDLAGPAGQGSVFSVPVTGGTPTVLASFNQSSYFYPAPPALTIVGNTIYGSSTLAGSMTTSTVLYSLPITGGNLTTFSPNADLAGPLVVVGGSFLGVGSQSFYSVPLAGGAKTNLAAFNTNATGLSPSGGLTFSGNTIYGVTSQGGTNADGTVYELRQSPISFTTAAPAGFGAKIGTINPYFPAGATAAATGTGYTQLAFSTTTSTGVYALAITDSVPASLSSDLTALAAQINGGIYAGSLTASTTDPLGGYFNSSVTPGGYDFYINVTNPALFAGSPYFGFDLTSVTGTTGTLSATAVAAVPEPVSMASVLAGTMVLGSRKLRRSRRQ